MMKMNGTLKRMKCFSFIFIRSDDISWWLPGKNFKKSAELEIKKIIYWETENEENRRKSGIRITYHIKFLSMKKYLEKESDVSLKVVILWLLNVSFVMQWL